MAADTKVFQDMADAMLPLFDNMPQVVVLVEDHQVFTRDPFPLAVYRHPNIIINPSHARTCSYDEIQETLCHELIHAWLSWKGLEGRGELLDEGHDELFVKKALEINKKRIESLSVDVDYLLATPKAVNIYNRVAGIQFAPYLRHKVRRVWKGFWRGSAVHIGVLLDQMIPDRLSKVLVTAFVAVVISLILNRARLIPNILVKFVGFAWIAAILGGYAVLVIRLRRR